MSDFEYYYAQGIPGIRAMCDCSSNTMLDTGEALKAADPTPLAESTGWIKWTNADSHRIGIDHATLEAAWKTLKARDLICDRNNIAPGCSFTGQGNWFMDQRERIEALVQKRAPQLHRWNLYSPAAELLRKMGITVTSPYSLMGRNRTQDPQPQYNFDPGSQSIRFMKVRQELLRIDLNQATFVDITTAAGINSVGEYNKIGILVTHTNNNVSYYVIENGSIIQRYENVNADTLSPR